VANHTQTVSESLRFFGVAPSNKWNEYNWNAFLWGEGTNKVPVDVQALLNSDTITFTDFEFLVQAKVIGESLSLAADPSSEFLTDGSGYTYVFPSDATDGEARDPVSWASAATGSGSWTSQAAATTSWSET
jgi:hypothetical protein